MAAAMVKVLVAEKKNKKEAKESSRRGGQKRGLCCSLEGLLRQSSLLIKSVAGQARSVDDVTKEKIDRDWIFP